ncbi:hypothetical protein SAMN04515674_11674 [Pseudarcicella hirudinis]|uniref:Uncharacterized protein n=1 Tax=Pseudarcicella hirudinis TaxID=1079859 RepID=A0A1I5XZU4_9BACT|nr:hypothetical protein [Pseudarcicella hirudinis]SFQ37521.1 hypothetical protein SAMN04515674_11674 [Pseudarcicella hirudinis]
MKNIPAESSETDAERPHDMEEYKQLTALFQFYLNQTVTTLNYTFLISGAVTSYILGTIGSDKPQISIYGILLPVAICFSIGLGFLKAIPSSIELKQALEAIKKRLNLQLVPHIGNLTRSLLWSGILLLLVSVSLLILFFMIKLDCKI